MSWTSPRTWVAGEKPPAATLNTHIRDNFKALGDAWAAWPTAPSWTAATTNPTLSNGTLTHGVMSAGKLTAFWVEIVMGSTTTYGSGSYSISLPYTEAAHRWLLGGSLRDASASATYPLFGERSVSGAAVLRVLPTTAGNALTTVNPTTPFTLGTGDVIFLTGLYEAA